MAATALRDIHPEDQIIIQASETCVATPTSRFQRGSPAVSDISSTFLRTASGIYGFEKGDYAPKVVDDV